MQLRFEPSSPISGELVSPLKRCLDERVEQGPSAGRLGQCVCRSAASPSGDGHRRETSARPSVLPVGSRSRREPHPRPCTVVVCRQALVLHRAQRVRQRFGLRSRVNYGHGFPPVRRMLPALSVPSAPSIVISPGNGPSKRFNQPSKTLRPSPGDHVLGVRSPAYSPARQRTAESFCPCSIFHFPPKSITHRPGKLQKSHSLLYPFYHRGVATGPSHFQICQWRALP